MRPIASKQNVIRHPLNELLGSPANVRLMRVLVEEVYGPISAAEAARKTGLTLAGARRALIKLSKTGFVEREGGKRSQRFSLRDSDPISQIIRDLFETENNRYRRIITQIRQVLAKLPEVRTAWIESPPTRVGEPLQIGILSDSRSLAYLGEQVKNRLAGIEQEFDLIIEIRTYSKADVPEDLSKTTELLAGHFDSATASSGASHAERDDRAARYSAAIVQELEQDPSLIKRATRYLDFLLEEEQGSAEHDLREWRDILTRYSVQRIKDFLVSETPRAIRLRQSSPFFAVLNAEERDRVIAFTEVQRDA